ncbi:hypothetical protein EX30DRAFT_268759 [Ascodesmis nigricans]|uniref:Uncharacterized protein n=1 Tax=Ascodesmis nigricans TaxID=341454 RepID=A0A4S2MWY0_9PEZI|nr:hypothetical protein EX30DRAFT_268759 [Ascodesmis nigricans]
MIPGFVISPVRLPRRLFCYRVHYYIFFFAFSICSTCGGTCGCCFFDYGLRSSDLVVPAPTNFFFLWCVIMELSLITAWWCAHVRLSASHVCHRHLYAERRNEDWGLEPGGSTSSCYDVRESRVHWRRG